MTAGPNFPVSSKPPGRTGKYLPPVDNCFIGGCELGEGTVRQLMFFFTLVPPHAGSCGGPCQGCRRAKNREAAEAICSSTDLCKGLTEYSDEGGARCDLLKIVPACSSLLRGEMIV